MPRTLTFPSPSIHVCPVCDEHLAGLPCDSCGADLARPESAELLQIDQELHRLTQRRGELIRRLLDPGRLRAGLYRAEVTVRSPTGQLVRRTREFAVR